MKYKGGPMTSREPKTFPNELNKLALEENSSPATKTSQEL